MSRRITWTAVGASLVAVVATACAHDAGDVWTGTVSVVSLKESSPGQVEVVMLLELHRRSTADVRNVEVLLGHLGGQDLVVDMGEPYMGTYRKWVPVRIPAQGLVAVLSGFQVTIRWTEDGRRREIDFGTGIGIRGVA